MKILTKIYRRRLEPHMIDVTAFDGDEVVGTGVSYYGNRKFLSDFLEGEFARGLSAIVFEDDGPWKLVGVLYGVEVDEHHRGKGVGSKIVEEMISWLRKSRVGRVYVQASPDLGTSEKKLSSFYKHLGFTFCCRTEDAEQDQVFYRDL